jgi:5-methylcytosine-specific restriction protein A
VPENRPSARQRGYDTRWEKARLTYLRHHPLCVICGKAGRIEAASVVDHIIPHRGDQKLFWDQTNWQALCRPHHDRDKQAVEKGGKARQAIGQDGWPIE